MPSLNKVLLMGNLTRDPELRNLPSGIAVCEMGMAISERFKGKDGQMQERVCYVDVVVWARQAETCGEYLRKGSPVFVEGSLQLDQWKSKEGENRSKLRVRADRVQFLSKPDSRAGVTDGGEDSDMGGGRTRVPAPEPPTGGSEQEPDSIKPGGDDDNLPF